MDGHLPGMDEVYFSFDDSGAKFPALFHAEHHGRIYQQPEFAACNVLSRKDGWNISAVFYPDDYSKRRPLRFNLIRLTDLYQTRYSWPEEKEPALPRLNLIFYRVANMGTLTE